MVADPEESVVSASNGKWQCYTQCSRSTACVVQGEQLNMCLTARIYDIQPNKLAANILSSAMKGWGPAKRRTALGRARRIPLV